MAHPRGIEPRIAVLEAATVTVRSGAWYSRQESNLHVDTRFERAASTDSATRVKLVGRGRLELACSGRLVLSEVCLPDSTTGPCPGRASNPQNCGSQPQASADYKERVAGGFTMLKYDWGVARILQGKRGTMSAPAGYNGEPGENPENYYQGFEISDKGAELVVDHVAAIKEAMGDAGDIPMAHDHFGHLTVKSCIELAKAPE